MRKKLCQNIAENIENDNNNFKMAAIELE